jgi:hypothetical protein
MNDRIYRRKRRQCTLKEKEYDGSDEKRCNRHCEEGALDVRRRKRKERERSRR